MKAEPIYIFSNSETVTITGTTYNIHEIESLTLDADGTIKNVVTKFDENVPITDCVCGHFRFSHIRIPAIYSECKVKGCECGQFRQVEP